MHDYTARILHEDRMTEYRREADASRLAAEARQGRPRTSLPGRVRGLAVLAHKRWTEGRAGRLALRFDRRRAGEVTPGAE